MHRFHSTGRVLVPLLDFTGHNQDIEWFEVANLEGFYTLHKGGMEGAMLVSPQEIVTPPPFLPYGLHFFYTNANAFLFEVAPNWVKPFQDGNLELEPLAESKIVPKVKLRLSQHCLLVNIKIVSCLLSTSDKNIL